MAKLSAILKNKRRVKKVKKYAEKRAALIAIIKNHKSSSEQLDEAYIKLQKLPRDSSRTRVRNRCEFSGRPRAYIRKFGLSRIAMRDMALRGDLPGVTKSSW
ncbi:MAG: 30S ribosomal protein S14 [Deltaproteobacteria bacterium]|jgi:small subunit ribosomal protein S14|nr:30S ribosomal protein S14 [Deltaproteobacteria bacterium]